MIIRIDNSYSVVMDNLSSKVLQEIIDNTSFFVKGAQYTPQYQNGSWDGRRTLFSGDSYKFPTGLVSVVKKIIESSGEKVKFQDVRVCPVKKFDLEFTFPENLRDYQEEIVLKGCRVQRGIIIVGTGGGKTLIGIKLIHSLGVKSLFIVNTTEALYDVFSVAKASFKGNEDLIGVYGDGKKKFGKFLTIATMGSISAAYKNAGKGKKNIFLEQGFECLIIDEVHHVGANTWFKAAMDINAFYKYGLTGTGFRTDNQDLLLRASTGRLIKKVPTKELQAGGYLASCEVNFICVEEPKELDRPLNYKECYVYGIVKNTVRNDLIERIVKKELGKQILVIVERTAHGEMLYDKIKKFDSGVKFIHGKSKNRKELKEAFTNTLIKTVIATRIYQESVDIPSLKIVINASGGKSGIKVIQSIGRALRIYGNESATLYDFYDSFNYKLEEHSKARIKWLKKEGHIVNIQN
jgi:DNA excision repair protein ERCC-3